MWAWPEKDVGLADILSAVTIHAEVRARENAHLFMTLPVPVSSTSKLSWVGTG